MISLYNENLAFILINTSITYIDLNCSQEFCKEGYYFPGGAVDAGETLAIAAHREALEEAGAKIVLKGILSIEFEVGSHVIHVISHLM